MHSSLRRASALVRAASFARRGARIPFYSDYSTEQPSTDAAVAGGLTGLESSNSAGDSRQPPLESHNAASEAVHWPRPSKIPYQAKVANSVSLIGRVHIPVQSQAAPDGKFWAGTVIAQDLDSSSDSLPLWIPVVFEGDLAHVAACHLKEHDRVHIGGHLSADSLPVNVNQGQANVQVMVQSINFVEGSYQAKASNTSHKYRKVVPNIQEDDHVKGAVSEQDNTSSMLSTDGLTSTKLDEKQVVKIWPDGTTKNDIWKDLFDNPNEWVDHRAAKLDGSKSPKYPDFKRKDRTAALWLNIAPRWVLSSIEGITFDAETSKSNFGRELQGEEAWKNLVNNPEGWWDNRLDKPKSSYPDFKHKQTRKGIWLDTAPSWVLPKLPPLKTKQQAENPSQEGTSSSREEIHS